MARDNFYNIKDLGEMSPEAKIKHYTAPPQSPRPTKSFKSHKTGLRALLVIVVLVVLIALAVTAWLIDKHHKTAKPVHQTFTVQPSTTSTSNTGTSNYVSNGSDLNLSFTYPSNWTVTPPTNDNTSDQTITLISPLTSITNAAGASVTGKVTLTVRPGTATITELNSNSPAAAATSAQMAYTTPTADQYQYPYLTFVHFSTSSNVAGAFEEAMITGSTQFSQGEALAADELAGLDPIISASFTSCLTQTCTGSGVAPLSITSTTWTGASIFQQTLAIFESFKLN